MYILVKKDVPLGLAMTSVAHASLACYLKFENTPEVTEWLSSSFRKVVCIVNDKEFEKAKTFEDNVVLTESTLGDKEISIALKPRGEWPKAVRFYSLYK